MDKKVMSQLFKLQRTVDAITQFSNASGIVEVPQNLKTESLAVLRKCVSDFTSTKDKDKRSAILVRLQEMLNNLERSARITKSN